MKNYKINSVKRVSDGEVFTVGDEVKFTKVKGPIKSFDITKFDEIKVTIGYGKFCNEYLLQSITKIEK